MAAKTPIHIFIVDNNNKIFVKMLDYIFTKEFRFRFLDFKSGEECLKNLHLNPDLIILDFALPGINGYDTLQHIKKSNPETNVIVLISEKDDKQPSELISEGVDYVLKENYGVAKIIEKLDTFLTAKN